MALNLWSAVLLNRLEAGQPSPSHNVVGVCYYRLVISLTWNPHSDKLQIIAEQHLVHVHQHVPVGKLEQIGSKPYQCDNCALFFAGKIPLNAHQKTCQERGTQTVPRDCRLDLTRCKKAELMLNR
jgi:hypothetical protein